MVVDHERAWIELKARLREREGVGIKTLFQLMSELEVECAVEEGFYERAVRMYGVGFSTDLIRGTRSALSEAHALAGEDAEAALPRSGDGSKEEDSERAGSSRAAVA